ncbi:MAG: ComF family protein, partial [Flavobacteriaceae bacterium]|nr:ComF family protein [Flavobacteriaceae bacterium]
ELAEHPDYSSIDGIVAVPLHRKKQRQRGYNQVDGFARALSESLNVPNYSKVLTKEGQTSTQVFKKRGKRFDSEGIFTLKDVNLIRGKHILLVDDIVTTGATLEKCALQLLKAPDVSISFATMAIA